MKILVVDDEKLIRDVVREYLEVESYEVVEASDGDKVDDILSKDSIDLIIMDIMMPHKDGFQTVKELRKNYNVPIIMLSARGEEYDKLIGFDLGIDDYVTKPFSPKELVARVKAILKRKKEYDNIIKVGDLLIDTNAHEVKIKNKTIMLTPKEYELLKFLV